MRGLALLLAGAIVLTGALLRDDATDASSPLTGAPAPVVPNGVGDVDRLQPGVQRAISRAIAAARADGVELRVTSGWRSADKQQALYDEAIRKYGSPERARAWVLPPEESEHVRGAAVDVGPEEGIRWLQRNGVRFGLCQRYENEPWHFERLAAAKGSSCPSQEPHA